MTYAIIKVAGKQYRVREGERLLVDRLACDEGETFNPAVLLIGGDGAPVLDPDGATVTAKVLGPTRGPKIRIGKYKKRTGYRRHTGFRAALSQIQIESIGGTSARAARRAKADKAAKPAEAAKTARSEKPAEPGAGLPAGYGDLTVVEIKAAAGEWSSEAIASALVYEHEHARRKGAIAALESALAHRGGES
jgi:large subunit ribosomal protein L21